ncbi:MAG: mucoidy inhibitor MuiA family protein, partial [Desulfonatronovibrio sp.]
DTKPLTQGLSMYLKLSSIKLIFVLCFVLVVTAPPSRAAVQKVTLFPASARVMEETTAQIISRENRKFVELILPAQADPAGINISALSEQSANVMDIAWERTDPMENQRVKELREKIENLIQEKTSLKISMESAQKGAAFWEIQSGSQADDLDALKELSGLIASNLQAIYTEIEAARQKIEDLNDNIQSLKKELEQITGPQNKDWKVKVFLESPENKDELTISYDYILNNCGWKSSYRLEAVPKQDRILFTWHAKVWQSSGKDWNDVDMTLATLEPQRELLPRPVPDWIIEPRREPAPLTAMSREVDKSHMADAGTMNLESAPVQERTGSYSEWILGQKSLAAGERPRFKIQEETWKAQFTHLVRPSVNNKSFIRAKVEFEEAKDLPPGEALFMLDKALMGKHTLRLAGSEQTLFFGHDPFVTTELIASEKKSGARGIISSKQTYLWDFTIRLENHHSYPVKIRMEEPKPMLRDDRIDASFDFSPEPDEQTSKLFIWVPTLEPGQTKDFRLNINMQAPEDMNIDWGWRR